MALFRGDFRSNTLGMDTSLTVVLPTDYTAPEQRTRLVYLLHGYGDNAGAWHRNVPLERLSKQYGVAFVMPEAQHSYYTNMAFGMRYADYLHDELPALAHRMFRLPEGRENTFIAGLSMGGFGALKAALTHPENYRACAGFSSVADFKGRMNRYKQLSSANEMQAIAGMDFTVGDEYDVYALSEKVARLPKADRPAFYMACGLQDGLIDCNREVQQALKARDFDVLYEEWEGRHDFGFWDVALRHALDYFMAL